VETLVTSNVICPPYKYRHITSWNSSTLAGVDILIYDKTLIFGRCFLHGNKRFRSWDLNSQLWHIVQCLNMPNVCLIMHSTIGSGMNQLWVWHNDNGRILASNSVTIRINRNKAHRILEAWRYVAQRSRELETKSELYHIRKTAKLVLKHWHLVARRRSRVWIDNISSLLCLYLRSTFQYLIILQVRLGFRKLRRAGLRLYLSMLLKRWYRVAHRSRHSTVTKTTRIIRQPLIDLPTNSRTIIRYISWCSLHCRP